jgi:hypothetical protein
MEAFKTFDKVKYLDDVEGAHLWEAIQSGEATKRPELLTRFVVLMFADLKKYHYYYWWAIILLSNVSRSYPIIRNAASSQTGRFVLMPGAGDIAASHDNLVSNLRYFPSVQD